MSSDTKRVRMADIPSMCSNKCALRPTVSQYFVATEQFIIDNSPKPEALVNPDSVVVDLYRGGTAVFDDMTHFLAYFDIIHLSPKPTEVEDAAYEVPQTC